MAYAYVLAYHMKLDIFLTQLQNTKIQWSVQDMYYRTTFNYLKKQK